MTNGNIFLSLGSNLGDRLSYLNKCIKIIGTNTGTIIRRSSVYETAAWGKKDQANFLNQVLEIESDLQPQALLESCMMAEKNLGRIRDEQWGARVIDIDIIYFDKRIINTGNLKIPHPMLMERKFVLIPLTEISPDFIHPISKKSNAQLLAECQDTLAVTIFDRGV